MQLKLSTMAISAIGLLLLVACSSGNQATNPPSSPAATPTVASPSKAESGEKHGGQGGQVIESGPYHLELVTGKEASGTHLDLFLQKGNNHEAIPTAKVMAQIQLPNGTQQSLEMKYNPDEKHYTAILPSTVTGEYKVVILSDINGEKVNGRFSFNQ